MIDGELLERLTVPKEQVDQVEAALSDFINLNPYLKNLKHPIEALTLMVYEIKNKGRQSYINRIYGRYRMLCPRYDSHVIKQFQQGLWERKSE